MTSTSPGLSRFTGAARHALTALALACASTAALADNFVISYTGTIYNPIPASITPFTEFISGESFTLSLILDNTGSTTASQTWNIGHVACAIWHINDAKNEVIVFDKAATTVPAESGNGSFTTNASGHLTDAPLSFEFGGITLPSAGITRPTGSVDLSSGTFSWMVRADLSGETPLISDGTRTMTADTSMTLASAWTTPRAVDNTADCATLAGQLAAAPAAAPTSTAAIPVLGAPGLVLLGTLTGLLGWRRMGSRAHRSA